VDAVKAPGGVEAARRGKESVEALKAWSGLHAVTLSKVSSSSFASLRRSAEDFGGATSKSLVCGGFHVPKPTGRGSIRYPCFVTSEARHFSCQEVASTSLGT
jgi:hypothetical protein